MTSGPRLCFKLIISCFQEELLHIPGDPLAILAGILKDSEQMFRHRVKRNTLKHTLLAPKPNQRCGHDQPQCFLWRRDDGNASGFKNKRVLGGLESEGSLLSQQ